MSEKPRRGTDLIELIADALMNDFDLLARAANKLMMVMAISVPEFKRATHRRAERREMSPFSRSGHRSVNRKLKRTVYSKIFSTVKYQ